MTRKNITCNQPLEKEIGFSRAVRIGNIIAITATAPIAKDGSVHTPDMYGQSKRCLEIIKDVIEQAGGKLDNVIIAKCINFKTKKMHFAILADRTKFDY